MLGLRKELLLVGTALIALSACASEKGPGPIGTKADIVVRNAGIPGQQPPTVTPAPAEQAVVEQGTAEPVAAVSSAPLSASPEPAPGASSTPENIPAAPESHTAAIPADAPPRVSALTTPMADSGSAPTPATGPEILPPPASDTQAAAPVVEPVATPPAPAVAPAPAPVAAAPIAAVPASQPAPAPAPEPVSAPAPSSVYPASDYPAAPETVPEPTLAPQIAAPVAQPIPAPVPAPVAAAPAFSPAKGPVLPQQAAPSPVLLNDPAVIRSAQAALKDKGFYQGTTTGELDAETLNALTRFQATNGLGMGGINEDTLRSLGVIE